MTVNLPTFKGYKTYIVVGLMLVYQLAGWYLYNHSLDIQSILEAAGIATLRAGVAKVTPPTA